MLSQNPNYIQSINLEQLMANLTKKDALTDVNILSVYEKTI